MKQIEIIDFSDFENRKKEIAQQIGTAWSNVGFYAAKNHNVDQILIDKAYQLMKEFYRLPLEIKMKYYRPEYKSQRGFMPNGSEQALGAQKPDYKEFIHFGPENDLAVYKNVWPEEIPELKETMLALYQEMYQFSQKILTATSLYLQLPQDSFTKLFKNGGESLIRSLYYPAPKEMLPKGVVRAAKHTDLNFITLLPNATTSGLEVKDRKNEWHQVPSHRELIICNCADMLQNMTNGVLLSTEHQVVNPADTMEERFSMPFFITPDLSSNISPIKSLINNKFSALDCTAEEFLKERLKKVIK